MFEMLLIELPGYKVYIVFVYRSPDREFDIFLNKLELVIQKLLMKDKILKLCGDWNIDFLHEDGNLKDLTDRLLRYNLVNTDQIWFQLMHHNFTLLTKSLYMFWAPTCPSSGRQTIYTPQLVQCHLL